MRGKTVSGDERPAWFHWSSGWFHFYCWPCHWKGWLLLLCGIAAAVIGFNVATAVAGSGEGLVAASAVGLLFALVGVLHAESI